MRVADGEVIEAALLGGITGDGEVCLVTLDIEGLTVDEAYANALVTRRTRGELRRGVVLAGVRGARCCIKHDVVGELKLEIGTIDHVNKGRKPATECVPRLIDRSRDQRVVVAREQNHRTGPIAPGEVLDHGLPPL